MRYFRSPSESFVSLASKAIVHLKVDKGGKGLGYWQCPKTNPHSAKYPIKKLDRLVYIYLICLNISSFFTITPCTFYFYLFISSESLHELWLLSVPDKLLLTGKSAGLVKNRDFNLVAAGYTNGAVKKVCEGTASKHLRDMTDWHDVIMAIMSWLIAYVCYLDSSHSDSIHVSFSPSVQPRIPLVIAPSMSLRVHLGSVVLTLPSLCQIKPSNTPF